MRATLQHPKPSFAGFLWSFSLLGSLQSVAGRLQGSLRLTHSTTVTREVNGKAETRIPEARLTDLTSSCLALLFHGRYGTGLSTASLGKQSLPGWPEKGQLGLFRHANHDRTLALCPSEGWFRCHVGILCMCFLNPIRSVMPDGGQMSENLALEEEGSRVIGICPLSPLCPASHRAFFLMTDTAWGLTMRRTMHF